MNRPRYTRDEKIRALQRELGYRNRVYPRLVDRGRMTMEECLFQRGIIEELLAEQEHLQREEAAKLQPDLFG